MNPNLRTIFLVTRQPLLIAGFRELLHWAGLGAEHSVLLPEELPQRLDTASRCLVIVDADTPVDWQTLGTAMRVSPESLFVLSCGQVTPEFAQAAVQSGVHGLVSSKLPIEEASQTLLQICHGERKFRWETGQQRPATISARLTRREQQVLALVMNGYKNREIAARLHTKEGSIKVYLHHIFRKTGSRSRYELALRARDAEWRPEPQWSAEAMAGEAPSFDATWMLTEAGTAASRGA
jgi:two-component system nitrate/nitrite response regulator NarL